MCGILGIVEHNSVVDRAAFNVARDLLVHRGPDGAGTWLSADGRVALGHRRLAIVDLSPAGQQPMTSRSRNTVITFNGEIYNYRELKARLREKGYTFLTETDTEVLLIAYDEWGCDCLEELSGMFAFAIYDQAKNIIFLARDRAGEKPLFYCHMRDQFSFASELKSLLPFRREGLTLNRKALDHYFAYGYISGDMCILSGYAKLEPGCAMTYHVATGATKQWRYWEVPITQTDFGENEDELTDELERRLENSLRYQLHADVPVAILLSGGVDSGVLAAIAAQVSSSPLQTFTVKFPESVSSDESVAAQAVAQRIGARHTEVTAEQTALELLPKLISQFDEPLADSSIVPTYLVSRLIRENATVALGGDGGDELFGGYPHYAWLQQMSAAVRHTPIPVLKGIGRAGQLLPLGTRGRGYITGLAEPENLLAAPNLLFDRLSRRKLLVPSTNPISNSPEARRLNLSTGEASIPRAAMRADFKSFLCDDVLVKVDRASMMCSLEVRAPYLDRHVVEFAFSRLPDRLRTGRGARKRILRNIYRRRLGCIAAGPKRGFAAPLDCWYQGRSKNFVRELILTAPKDLFCERFLQRMLQSQDRGRKNISRIFAVAVFELWRRSIGIQ